jgi:hypothetical protein
MIANSPSVRPVDSRLPTIWGLDPVHLHDRFWAARGVFVVRRTSGWPLPSDAQLFMLTDARTLALFPLTKAVDRLYWVRPEVLFIRCAGRTAAAYRELAERTMTADFSGLSGTTAAHLDRLLALPSPAIAVSLNSGRPPTDPPACGVNSAGRRARFVAKRSSWMDAVMTVITTATSMRWRVNLSIAGDRFRHH